MVVMRIREFIERNMRYTSGSARLCILCYEPSALESDSIILGTTRPVLGGVLPCDDEWIVAKTDVKKYGLIALSTLVPELGWEGESQWCLGE